MGAIAEGIAAYVQPLVDQTDGSMDQLNKAYAIGQLCWNLSLMPEEKREESLRKFQPALKMSDEELADFRNSIVMPMIDRHHRMFPGLHRKRSTEPLSVERWRPAPPADLGERPRIGRNDPCPCNSGKKYKRCCGR